MRLRLLLVSACVLPLLAACKDDKKKEAPPAPPVKVSGPIHKPLHEWDEYTGRFVAQQRVQVNARVNGYLSEIRFVDGQDVKKGDVLFVIDQRPFKITLDSAAAAEQLARKNFERAKSLVSSGAIAKQDFETLESNYIAAKSNLAQAKLNLEFTEVTAPVSGRVSRHMVDVGNLISGGDINPSPTLLTTVVSEDPIYFYFEANENDILKYNHLDDKGERESSRTNHRPLYIKMADEKDFVHEGKMDFVDNEIDRGTGTLQARASVPNPKGEILPGMFGRARLAGSGDYTATLVPDDVIGSNQTVKFVYVVNADNVIEPHPVTLGPLYDNNLRIIRDGVKDDDKIVMAGITTLHPGMKVTPTPMEAKPDAPADAAAPKQADPKEENAKPDDDKTSNNAGTPAAQPSDKKTYLTPEGKDVDADDESDDTPVKPKKKGK